MIVDRYRLPLPDATPRLQAWQLHIVLYETATGARLPWNLHNIPISDHASLSLVRVGASAPLTFPQKSALAAPVAFQNAIQLSALTFTPDDDRMHITVWWESLAPLTVDYTVFMHLFDAAGNTVANADAPPLSGGFPTTLWQPGDVISDTYTLPLLDPDANYTLRLGWYDLQTGWRLEAVQEGNLLPDAALSLDCCHIE